MHNAQLFVLISAALIGLVPSFEPEAKNGGAPAKPSSSFEEELDRKPALPPLGGRWPNVVRSDAGYWNKPYTRSV